jgi:hypothetical protein
MNWLAFLAPLLERAAPWLARKLFPDPHNPSSDPHNPDAARHGAAAGEAARRASREAGK